MLKKLLCLLLCFSLVFTMVGSISSFTVFADEETEEIEETEAEGLVNDDHDEVTFREEEVGDFDASDDALYGGSDDEVDTSVEVVEAAVTKNGVYSDIEDKNTMKYAEILSAMGFIGGYDDGTFKPENEISRVDFMSVLIKTLNLTPETASVEGYNFYDVTPGTWEYNVMSFAVKHNLYTVYNDNTVRPNAPITYMDAAVAYLRAMGYAATAEATGGYIYGYATIANQLDLDSGVKITENLLRGEAVRLIFNCVSAPINKAIKYGTFVQYSNDTNENILSYYHKIYLSKGVVTSTTIDSLGDYVISNAGFISIGDKTYICDKKDYATLLGYKVEYYYKNTIDGDRIVIIQKHRDVNEITIKGDDVIGYKNGKLRYLENDKERSLKIELNHTFIKNNRYCKDYSPADFKPNPGYITVVANDGENYDVVRSYEYYNGVAKSVTALVGLMTITLDHGMKPIEVDVSNKNLFIEMYTDGNKMDVDIKFEQYYDGDGILQERTILPKIPAGSLISVFSDSFEKNKTGKNVSIAEDARYMRIIINTPSVTGTVKTYDKNENVLQIGKKEYDISSYNFLDSTDEALELGSKGIFLMDYHGEIAAWVPAIATFTLQYGYLINAGKNGELASSVLAKVLTYEGDIKLFNMDRNVQINGVKAGNLDNIMTKLTASARLLDSASTEVSQLVKYYSPDGENITKLMTVTAETGVAPGFDEKTQLRRYEPKQQMQCYKDLSYTLVKNVDLYKLWYKENADGSIRVENDGTALTSQQMTYAAGQADVLFVVPSTPTFDDDDYYVKKDGWDYGENKMTAEVYDMTDLMRPTAMIVYNDAKTNKTFEFPMMVISKISDTIEDNVEKSMITGFRGAAEESYIVEDKTILNGFKKGDIVIMKGVDDVVKELVKVANIEDIVNYNYDDPTIRVFVPAPALTKGTAQLATSMYEAYYTDTVNRIMYLQLGPDDDGDGKRTTLRTSFWSGNTAVMHHNATLVNYYKDSGKFTLSTANINNVKGAREYGHESSSKILLGEQNNIKLRYAVIVNVL